MKLDCCTFAEFQGKKIRYYFLSFFCVRILHQADQRDDESQQQDYMLVSECMSQEEALGDWSYLERHLLSVLADFEGTENSASEQAEFVRVKINSLLAVAEDSSGWCNDENFLLF